MSTLSETNTPRSAVICAGEVLVDLIGDPAAAFSETRSFIPRVGGAPANVAAGIARLGGSARFLGTVANDDIGHWQLSLLERAGVDVSLVRFVDEAQSRLALVTGTEDEREFRFYGHPPADNQLSPGMIDPGAISTAAALYLGSLLLATEPSRGVMERLLEIAEACDVPVVFDPNPRRVTWPHPDIAREVILPLVRRSQLVKVGGADLAVLDIAIEDIVAHASAKSMVVLTDGPRGCRYWYGESQGESVPAPAVNQVDPTGAGDAFTAALTLRLVETGGDLTPYDLRFACAAGALATTAIGAMDSLPARAEVVELLDRTSGRDQSGTAGAGLQR
jgi:fructokinase